MLQYLLNATAIWLISLVLFDVFLRRESYHGYNRFYLLATFLLGIFLPLVQWEEDSRPLVQTLQQPMERVIAAKQNIVAATTPAASADWQQWVAVIYVAGILVALCLLVIEVIKLVSCYRSRKKSYDGRWPIIETGKDHAPFSFLNTLFVCSKGQYSANEWNMILVHEHRHSALLHFADLLLMQAARIIFWFHPLVYVYNKRLLLVHEFQADSVAAGQPQVYGTFLIEQAVLQAAPSVSHSFNRSPIKNRIVMLTRKSSAASRVKMLVFVPLALVCVVCFSQNIAGKHLPTITLGDLKGFSKGKENKMITKKEVLANTKLICHKAACKVTGFRVIIAPKGRDLYGPYWITGDQLTEKVKSIIKELPDMRTNIYIDSLQITDRGKKSQQPGIYIKYGK